MRSWQKQARITFFKLSLKTNCTVPGKEKKRKEGEAELTYHPPHIFWWIYLWTKCVGVREKKEGGKTKPMSFCFVNPYTIVVNDGHRKKWTYLPHILSSIPEDWMGRAWEEGGKRGRRGSQTHVSHIGFDQHSPERNCRVRDECWRGGKRKHTNKQTIKILNKQEK